MKHRAKWLAGLVLVMPLILSGCGGSGGDTPGVSSVPVVAGTVQPEVKVISATQMAELTSLNIDDAGGVLLQSSDLQKLGNPAVGDVLYLPGKSGSAMPFGFAGRVVSVQNATGGQQIKLMPANVEEVFQKIKWDIDTQRNGGSIVGVVTPTGSKASFGFVQEKSLMNPQGLLKAISGGITGENGTFGGTLEYSQDVTIKDTKVTAFGTINLSNLRVRSQADFDVKNIMSDSGWANVTAVVSGDISAQFGVRGPKDSLFSFSIADLFNGTKVADGWKTSVKNSYFELEGLKGDDKKGRLPLGGVVIRPALGSGTPFLEGNVNALPAEPIVILWLYLDGNGQIEIKGEVGSRFNIKSFEQGYEFKAVGAKLESKKFSSASPQSADLPYLKGSFKGTQNFGMSIVADVIVGGVRPATVGVFIGHQLDAKIEGEGAFSVWPKPELTGQLCWNVTKWAGIQLNAAVRIKAKTSPPDWLKVLTVDGTAEWSGSAKVMNFTDEYSTAITGCMASGDFDFSISVADADPATVGNMLVYVDFANAYGNSNVKTLADSWKLKVEDGTTSNIIDIPLVNLLAGNYSVSLAAGKTYSLTFYAEKQDYGTVRWAWHTVQIPALPAPTGVPTPIPTSVPNPTTVPTSTPVPVGNTGRINDTGIVNAGYDANGNYVSSCASAAPGNDCNTGRDATNNDNSDGKAGFSFTKLDANGNALPATATSWSCVKDNVTGLIWEVKTNDGGLHDWNKTYTNYDSNNGTQTQIDAATNSVGLKNAVNAQGLCGASDWRLPSVRELMSIVDYGAAYPGPMIDGNWFSNTNGTWYWSSSTTVRGSNTAWGIDLGSGDVSKKYDRFNKNAVRLVRAGQRLGFD